MNRVVTGLGADGRATIVHADVPAPLVAMGGSKNETRLCWATSGPPALPYDGVDPIAAGVPVFPPPGETRFLLLTFTGHFKTALHATPTTDYVAVLSGEIWLVMEDGTEHHLAAGDTVIQHGTKHIWDNRSAEPCTIAATLFGVGAKT